jgi:ankyrin
MTDDKEEKTLEHQEHFHEIAKSRDVEVSLIINFTVT